MFLYVCACMSESKPCVRVIVRVCVRAGLCICVRAFVCVSVFVLAFMRMCVRPC